MGARSDIMAGKAYVELYVKNSLFFKGMSEAKKDIQDFGKGIMRVGGFLTTAGAGILAPLALMVKHFAEFGSVLYDVSQRTGRTASDLAELQYAAEQTGASLADVEKALKFQQKSGSKETFEQAAERIAAISDPALKAAAAIKTWGKAGTMLIPMLADLKALRAEAIALGRPTDEEARLADDLGDAFGRMTTLAKNAAFAIGGALAPTILNAGETIEHISTTAMNWVRQNGELIRTVAKVAAGLMVAGLVILGIGATVYAVGAAFGLAATLASAFGVVLGVIMSPVVLWTAALGLLLYKTKALGTLWTWMGNTLAPVGARAREVFGAMQEDFDTAWKGIQDAIAAGDLGLAAEVAWAGLRVIWQRGTQDLNRMWLDVSKYFRDTWLNASEWLAKNMLDTVAGFKGIWNDFGAFIAQTFNSAAKTTLETLNGMVVQAQKLMIDLSVVGDNPEEIAAARAAANAKKSAIDVAEAGWKQKRDARFGAQESAIEAGRQIQNQKIGADIAAQQKVLDEDMARRRHTAEEGYKAALAAKESALERAKAELATAVERAADARARLGAGPKRGDLPGIGLPDFGAVDSKSASTFSAAGAVALGQGGGNRTQERIAKAVEGIDDKDALMIELTREVKRELKNGRAGRFRT